jgi:uncharacterized protein (DUF362 family)
MGNISRRDFLRGTVAGLGAMLAARFLAACSAASPQPAPDLNPMPVKPAETGAAKPAAAASYPHIAVVKGKDPEAITRAAVNALGGIGRFIKKGDNVIIKPNIGPNVRTWEHAATTNPWVVGAVVRMCFEAGAGRVRVMDRPFGGTPEAGYTASGIKEQVEKAGGQMEIMSRVKFLSTEIPEGRDIKKWDIYEDILRADALINIPIAKQHSGARLTLGLKNMMGVIGSPHMFHMNIHQRIADLATRIRPTLTIIDAVRILVANGPTGGNMGDVRFTDTIIAGTDTVALDSYATRLFNMQPDDVPYIGLAASMGIGNADLSKLEIKEIALES